MRRAQAHLESARRWEEARAAGRIPSTLSGDEYVKIAFKLQGCCVCKRGYPELDFSELHIDHTIPLNGAPTNLNGNRQNVAMLVNELLTYQCVVRCGTHHLERHGARAEPGEQAMLFAGTGEAWRIL